jgi:hypothetical protein
MLTKRIRIKGGGVMQVSHTPLLDHLVVRGVVCDRDGEWVGRAADGTTVSLGSTPEDAERYLTQHPDPKDW